MSDRDVLFERLASMWQSRDPMPEGLADRALAAIAMEDFDDEYELLNLVERSHRLQGVRGAGDAITIEFSRDQVTMLLRVSTVDGDRRRVDGWVTPNRPMRVVVRQDATAWTTVVGRLGRFELASLPPGLTRIWLMSGESTDPVEDEADRQFATPLFEI